MPLCRIIFALMSLAVPLLLSGCAYDTKWDEADEEQIEASAEIVAAPALLPARHTAGCTATCTMGSCTGTISCMCVGGMPVCR